jgi:starch synthase
MTPVGEGSISLRLPRRSSLEELLAMTFTLSVIRWAFGQAVPLYEKIISGCPASPDPQAGIQNYAIEGIHNKYMKILFVAAEANPLVKVGGLGDVVGSLPAALNRLGHDVRILIPCYGSLDTRRFPLKPVGLERQIILPGRQESCSLYRTSSNGVTVYTLENAHYFGGPEVYTSADLERFYCLARAVFELLPDLDWQPQIIHCHDWHTALLVMWLGEAKSGYQTVFTIHNLAYQGVFDENFLRRFNLQKYWQDLPAGAPSPPLCFMAQGILRADLVTTVSENYAREIALPEYGMGLDALLRYRQNDLMGIVNGLDYDEWNPATDPYLPVNFSAENLNKRIFNKYALQRVAGFPVDENTPLIGMVQRLDGQKGLDLLGASIERLFAETPARVVVLGKGWDNYESMVQSLNARFPGRFAGFIGFAEPLSHLIYGGSDIFLMPSRFEPCGLGQLIAMRYGALPVVRHTGGLVDTVPPFNADLSRGNGFVFHEFTPEAMLGAVKLAIEAFKDKERWQRAVQRVMQLDFSWESSAKRYEGIYREVLGKKQKGI